MNKNDTASVRGDLPRATAFALIATMLVATGYVAGYVHGFGTYDQSAPGFMLGFAVAAVFALPALYIANRGDSDD